MVSTQHQHSIHTGAGAGAGAGGTLVLPVAGHWSVQCVLFVLEIGWKVWVVFINYLHLIIVMTGLGTEQRNVISKQTTNTSLPGQPGRAPPFN